eukprot:COSAG01_NODE_3028_length_6703_cov_2.824955_6_plen_177_part_00
MRRHYARARRLAVAVERIRIEDGTHRNVGESQPLLLMNSSIFTLQVLNEQKRRGISATAAHELINMYLAVAVGRPQQSDVAAPVARGVSEAVVEIRAAVRHLSGQAFPLSIFRDKNGCGIGKYQPERNRQVYIRKHACGTSAPARLRRKGRASAQLMGCVGMAGSSRSVPQTLPGP